MSQLSVTQEQEMKLFSSSVLNDRHMYLIVLCLLYVTSGSQKKRDVFHPWCSGPPSAVFIIVQVLQVTPAVSVFYGLYMATAVNLMIMNSIIY